MSCAKITENAIADEIKVRYTEHKMVKDVFIEIEWKETQKKISKNRKNVIKILSVFTIRVVRFILWETKQRQYGLAPVRQFSKVICYVYSNNCVLLSHQPLIISSKIFG